MSLSSAVRTATEAAEFADDPRFAANAGRMENLKELETLLNEKFVTRTSAEWLSMLEAEGVPAGPVLSIAEMHADPHVAARQMLTRDAAGNLHIGVPIKFKNEPGRADYRLPGLGEHTGDVLKESDVSEADIAAVTGAGHE